MKKIISYCLFNLPSTERWLFFTYFRGLVWNVKMNKCIYPQWISHIEVDSHTFSQYDHIFYGLRDLYGCSLTVNEQMPKGLGMLTRLKKIFDEESEWLIARDADAITTYREATAVQEWVNETKETVFSLKDNNAHSIQIMGGMSGFRCEPLREKYGTWQNFIDLGNGRFANHNDDQIHLMKVLYPDFKDSLRVKDMRGVTWNNCGTLENVESKYKTSSLIPAFIGSAGINSMEYTRFEKDYLRNGAFEAIEKIHPEIFYQWL